ncbi:MAG: hypothetical protein HY820_31480 [Acidobacteria bacterium]|nr:hypothetical protein [Acidobacteriota bacterium]
MTKRMTIVMLILPALGLAQPTECEGVNVRVKAVARNSPQWSTVDFANIPFGQLDPTPLLQTEFRSTGSTCVVVHFSAQADPQDNHILFQASIDNVPMSGHAQFPYLTPAPATPVVWDPEESNFNLSRMLSYTFVAVVGPGQHTVRIRFAGCCSSVPGGNSALVRNAVMSVHF